MYDYQFLLEQHHRAARADQRIAEHWRAIKLARQAARIERWARRSERIARRLSEMAKVRRQLA